MRVGRASVRGSGGMRFSSVGGELLDNWVSVLWRVLREVSIANNVAQRPAPLPQGLCLTAGRPSSPNQTERLLLEELGFRKTPLVKGDNIHSASHKRCMDLKEKLYGKVSQKILSFPRNGLRRRYSYRQWTILHLVLIDWYYYEKNIFAALRRVLEMKIFCRNYKNYLLLSHMLGIIIIKRKNLGKVQRSAIAHPPFAGVKTDYYTGRDPHQ